jgi:hypothetical protein
MSGVEVTSTGAGVPRAGVIMGTCKAFTVANTPPLATDLHIGMATGLPATITTVMAVQVMATGTARRSKLSDLVALVAGSLNPLPATEGVHFRRRDLGHT